MGCDEYRSADTNDVRPLPPLRHLRRTGQHRGAGRPQAPRVTPLAGADNLAMPSYGVTKRSPSRAGSSVDAVTDVSELRHGDKLVQHAATEIDDEQLTVFTLAE